MLFTGDNWSLKYIWPTNEIHDKSRKQFREIIVTVECRKMPPKLVTTGWNEMWIKYKGRSPHHTLSSLLATRCKAVCSGDLAYQKGLQASPRIANAFHLSPLPFCFCPLPTFLFLSFTFPYSFSSLNAFVPFPLLYKANFFFYFFIPSTTIFIHPW